MNLWSLDSISKMVMFNNSNNNNNDNSNNNNNNSDNNNIGNNDDDDNSSNDNIDMTLTINRNNFLQPLNGEHLNNPLNALIPVCIVLVYLSVDILFVICKFCWGVKLK